MFKKRKSGDESMAAPAQAESIEAIRRRARHRLIGATVLVLIGVVAFPLLFDTQPRPIAVDIPIEIPDRNKVNPLPAPAQPAAKAPVVSGPVTVAPAPAAPPAVAVASQPAPASAVPETPPVAKAQSKPEPEPEPKVAAKPAP